MKRTEDASWNRSTAIKRAWNIRRLAFSLTLLTALGTLGIIGMRGISSGGSFDKEKWDESTRRGVLDVLAQETGRKRLARTLVEGSFLVGQKRAELVDMLGEPARDLLFPESAQGSSSRLAWSLGGNAEVDTLYVDLDPAGIALDAWLAGFAHPEKRSTNSW